MTPMHRRITLGLLSLPLAATLLAALPAAANAPALPYDESANAQQDVQRALDSAAKTNRPVLVVFGANWCGDCRALDLALKAPTNAALMDKEFVVVKVDVGKFDRNLDVVERTGVTIKKGIPAAAVLSPQGKLLYATQGGELANARKMSETGVHDFFAQVVATAKGNRPAP
jgi:thioredoxin 1